VEYACRKRYFAASMMCWPWGKVGPEKSFEQLGIEKDRGDGQGPVEVQTSAHPTPASRLASYSVLLCVCCIGFPGRCCNLQAWKSWIGNLPGVAPEAALYYGDPVRVHPSAVVIFENVKALEYEVPNETQHKIATSTQATWGPVCF